MNPSFRCRVAGGHDDPPIRQAILAQPAVEHQLIASGLRHLRRGRQLIEEENAFTGGGQEPGRHPFGLIGGDPRQTAQINRVKLHRADIEKLIAEIVGDLVDDL